MRKEWHSDYSKNYRDALAHRIPLYVAPSLLIGAEEVKYLELESQIQALDPTDPEEFKICEEISSQQAMLGRASPFFAHSVGEGARHVYMHAQIVTDFVTIEELVNKFCEQFETERQRKVSEFARRLLTKRSAD